MRRLEKENADLQADVDAFIAEQDDLRSEIEQLKESKASLNDMLSRLKREASVELLTRERANGGNAASSVGGAELRVRSQVHTRPGGTG